MFKLPKLFKVIPFLKHKQTSFNTCGLFLSLHRRQINLFSSSESAVHQTEDLLLFFESKLKTSPNVSNFSESLQILNTLYTGQHLTREQIKPLYEQCIEYFNSIQKNDFQEEQLSPAAEQMTQLFQGIVETLEPNMVIAALDSWSRFDPKYSKPYWHFVEFLLTRTKFMNLFEGDQIVKMLDSYYEIKDKYEPDKFAYIFDKCDQYICEKSNIKFSHEDLARLLYLYTQCNLGSDLFFQKMFEQFAVEKHHMNMANLITCAASFVSYNLTTKDRDFIVYDKGIYDKVLANVKDLNSYQVKQFLWSYHKEREIFKMH